MTIVYANSQNDTNQKTQDDRYSNLNPKPRPEEHPDSIRNPDPTQYPGTEPGTSPQDEPNPSQYPERHPDEIPAGDPNEIPDQKMSSNQTAFL